LDAALRLRTARQKRVLLASGGVNDVPSGQALLRKQHPDWVLVGNSMLNSRIETEYLKTLSGLTPFKLNASGSKSPMWFLFLKRIIVESGEKPKCVTVFFRDRDLTWPECRMNRNEEMIERMQGRDQPEWEQVMGRYDAAANRSFKGVVKWASSSLNDLLPGEKLRNWGRGKMQKTAFKLSAFGSTMSDDDRRDELNAALSYDHQRQMDGTVGGDKEEDEAEDAQPNEIDADEPLIFEDSRTASFLPHMVALAKQHGFTLHFHRVKRRPDPPDNTPSAQALPGYMASLKTYLESNGCLFTDESEDDRITYDMYVDGDHIRNEPRYQQPYMDLFWRRVQPLVTRAIHPAKPLSTVLASPQ
jgi:hypothetical protein